MPPTTHRGTVSMRWIARHLSKRSPQTSASRSAANHRMQGTSQTRALRMRKRFEQAAAAVTSHRGEPWEAFSMRRGDPGRDMVWWLARRHSGLTVRELGEKSGAADYAAVGMALSPYESKLRSNDDLRSETILIERNLEC